MSTEISDKVVFGLSDSQNLFPDGCQFFIDSFEYFLLLVELHQNLGHVGLLSLFFELDFVDVSDEGV